MVYTGRLSEILKYQNAQTDGDKMSSEQLSKCFQMIFQQVKLGSF